MSNLSKARADSESIRTAKNRLLGSGIKKDRARTYLNRFFPGTTVGEFETVYMPVYRITLRRGNTVRVFTINGIDGRSAGAD